MSLEDNQLGGCVAGCLSTFSSVPVGINLNVSFTYDDKTNAVAGANIGWSIDSTATFIGPSRAPTVNQFSPIPSQMPTPQALGVNVNASALKSLSAAQLQALARSSANVPVAMIREALQKAVQQEQQRRADEQRKQEEERKKGCQSGQTGDCSPSGN